jgi:hypothetical protein
MRVAKTQTLTFIYRIPHSKYHETYEGVFSALKFLHVELTTIEGLDGVPALMTRSGKIFAVLRYLLESKEQNAVFRVERRLGGQGRGLNTFCWRPQSNVSETLNDAVFGFMAPSFLHRRP